MKMLMAILSVCLVAGCASQAGPTRANVSQTISTGGSVYGVPVSGAVRIGANQNGVHIQPNISVRSIRFSR